MARVKLHRWTRRILAEKGLPVADFAAAVEKARAAMDAPAPPQRMLLCAALCYQPGGRHLDLGGGTSLYNPILRCLGMDVTVVDLFIGEEDGLARLAALGIATEQSDLYAAVLPERTYDGISMFETIEHLPHSPKPILEKVVTALKPGGRFVLSVPNMARSEDRMRMLMGRNPMGKYRVFFRDGNPFLGHHREMTMDEARWAAEEIGLTHGRVRTTDHRYKPIGKPGLSRWLAEQNDLHGISDILTPPGWRRQIWLTAERAAQPE